MISLNVVIEAFPGKEVELENALLELIPEVEKEKETYIYILNKSVDNSCKFVFYELYKDRNAMDFHFSTDHFKKTKKNIKNLVKKQSVEICEVVDSIKKI